MENLTNDILDEDFVEIFRWLHYFQNILGYSRVEIKDRFVTQPKKAYTTYCFILWIIIIPASTFHYLMTTEVIKYGVYASIDTIYLPYQYACIALIASSLVYLNHFDKSDLNCQLFVQLQRIDRLLGAEFVAVNKVLSMVSKAVAVVSYGATGFWLFASSYMYHTDGSFYLNIFLLLTPVAYSVEIVLFMLILKYVIVRVEYIVNKLKVILHTFKNSDLNAGLIERDLYGTEEQRPELITERLIRGVHAILSSMFDIEEIYQPSIFCGVGSMLMLSHCVFLLIFAYSKTGVVPYELGFGFVVMYPPHVFTALLMSFYGYTLTELFKQIKRLCSSIISCPTVDEETVKNANRILLLLNAKSPTISIFGVLTVDQNLPLHIFGMVTSYTILHIQFTAIH